MNSRLIKRFIITIALPIIVPIVLQRLSQRR